MKRYIHSVIFGIFILFVTVAICFAVRAFILWDFEAFNMFLKNAPFIFRIIIIIALIIGALDWEE